MPIKVHILYQVSCIWPQLIFVMSVFLYTLLIVQLHAKAEKPICRMMGDPKYPLLSKDGDVNIGALFSVHSVEILPSFKYIQTPHLLSCSRFKVCYFVKYRAIQQKYKYYSLFIYVLIYIMSRIFINVTTGMLIYLRREPHTDCEIIQIKYVF